MGFKLSKKVREYHRTKYKEMYWTNQKYRKAQMKKMMKYYYENPEYFRAHQVKQWKRLKKDPVALSKRHAYLAEYREKKLLEKINAYRADYGLTAYPNLSAYKTQKENYRKMFEMANKTRKKKGMKPFQSVAYYKYALAKKKGVCLQQLRY